ncbi:Formamidopyrimidine-DNA glycosylase [Cedratvirus A11]|uniref:Formamidopyrimidine-DNA glycosylase n=1 Tax=Cedratvirus A11 TaxID=1903266 RepID=A0A1M7XU37_9VIRU|nr:Formamidopyrimidine-DNA glycosylase [Cedratvirus A11]SHO33195.1 Formamidopyrimidine-DNA glycosylase [Cedratvirus A11]
MPEGPEVRNITRKLNIRLAGANLISFSIGKEKDLLQNLTIVNVACRGKLIVFILVSPSSEGMLPSSEQENIYITSSLGMTGSWTQSKGSYTKAVLYTSVGNFYYEDMRGFGKIAIHRTEEELDQRLSKIGFDLLEASLNHPKIPDEQWLSFFNRKSRKKICVVLLEQDKIAGIGNYLRSEILHQAKINPHRIISSLSDEELLLLRDAAQEVIVRAYRSNGLTIKDYVDPEGEKGSFVCSVYGRKTDEQGRKVITEKVSGRSIFYVEN